MSHSIAEISAKLVTVIQTRDVSRVRYIADVLDRQKNASLTVDVFSEINSILESTDKELQVWFQDIYFEGCSPEVKKLWIEFTALSLKLNSAPKAS